ncbi:MAG: LEA type 2 family protein [Candidatus Thermoplasmatota archaeon]|nr:LEA type 2 family protein [Candidatus Thermoplasmatota archaeon]
MNKTIVTILVVATIINIGVGTVLFLDIRAMDFPDTLLTVEIVDVTADDARLTITLWVNNPNSFPLLFHNVSIKMMSETTTPAGYLSLGSGEIPASENKTFTATTTIHFSSTFPDELSSTITGAIGVDVLGIIRKTLPIHLTVRTPLTLVETLLTLPSIELQGNFSTITQNYVDFTEIINITNPYPFDLTLDDLSTTLMTNTGQSVGSISIPGQAIPAHTSHSLSGTGKILLKVLDAASLTMNLTGIVTVKIAGVEKTMTLTLASSLTIPQIDDLLSTLPTEGSLTGKYTPTLRGVQDHIICTIVNPHNLSFIARNITVFIYRVDRDTQRLLCNGTIPDGIITPQATTSLEGVMVIPYRQLFPRRGERLLADRLAVTLRANITIDGLNQTLWLGATVYQDYPFHRLKIFS